MSLRFLLPSCAKVRLAIAALSFVGFVVFLVVCLRPPPSILIPNLPHTGHKVSVVILPTPTSGNLTQLALQAGLPIIAAHIESEFIMVSESGKKAESAARLLRQKGSHVEVVPALPSLMLTLSEAFGRAHFSQILVYGDDRVPVETVLPELVQPVIAGKVDMAMVEYSDKSSVLSLLSYPITGHLASASNSTVFSLHTAVWQRDCHDVSLTASSPSLELLAKCDLHSFSSFAFPLSSPHQDHLIMFAQVHLLYWQLHPIWCTLLSLLMIALVILLTVQLVWRRNHIASKKPSRTLHAVIA